MLGGERTFYAVDSLYLSLTAAWQLRSPPIVPLEC
jgi:hypothetical protein